MEIADQLAVTQAAISDEDQVVYTVGELALQLLGISLTHWNAGRGEVELRSTIFIIRGEEIA